MSASPSPARVLVIEDDAAMSASLMALLEVAGFQVQAAPSAEIGVDDARRHLPDLVLLDIHLPGRSGLEALPELLRLDPPPAVLVITAEPSAETAMEAMAQGAFDHLVKPVEPGELREAVARALAAAAARRVASTGAGGLAEVAEAPRLVGSSRPMLALGRRVGALARADVTVLIRGESGTGKELAARAIHERSARARAPFVALSCAAIPEALLEAELFGHERGAFTGAQAARAGRIEEAQGGTLFLDEVGELTLPAQGKLLRFLEERSFERVGGGATRRADVRVLAATNSPLVRRVEEGTFREDLYYRLDVARLELPPLRDRPEDLPLLVEHLLRRLARAEVRVLPAAIDALRGRSWPGNVRELRNTLEAALVALGPGHELTAEHLPAARRDVGAEGATQTASDELERAVRALVLGADEPAPGGADDDGDGGAGLHASVRSRVERALIGVALERTGNNQVAAARLLGMNRATFRRKMSDLGLT